MAANELDKTKKEDEQDVLLPKPKVLKGLQAISLEQQRQMIDRTFEEIKQPVYRHPTNPRSDARPVSILPIFPDSNFQSFNFIQIQFDVAPNDNSQNLIKDCGNYLVNFNPIQQSDQTGEQIYLSDQRYSEEKTAENAELEECFILKERDGCLYYVGVEKHMKLRRELPRPQAMANKCLLQVKRVPMETK
uniref:RNA polymerase II-associated factor 1 homolog n=1 Tax=Drosophila rhopaloa TaxID=1041015 RepID=A0A6P4EMI8_DRORH